MTTGKPTTTTYDVLAFVRALRHRGDTDTAAAVLDATLSQPQLHEPATVELAAETGWLHLERSDVHAAAGELRSADDAALNALRLFERAQELAGAAAACLQLGDLDWQAGLHEGAQSWWARARSLADAAGATPLAARALLGLALRELGAGDATVADAQLAAAADRAAHDLTAALSPDDATGLQAAQRASDAVRASLALVQARRALAARNWPEVRLLLASVAETARRLQEPALYVDALRLDAVLARRLGDAATAAESLQLALEQTVRSGDRRLEALLRAELVPALVDAGRLQEAVAAHEAELPSDIAILPSVHAARLEGYAAIALAAGQEAAAEPGLREALAVRRSLGDAAGVARVAAVLAETLLRIGRTEDAKAVAQVTISEAQAAGRPDLALAGEITLVRLALAVGGADALPHARATVQKASDHGSVGQILAAVDALVAAQLAAGESAAAADGVRRLEAAALGQPQVRWHARALARKAQVLAAGGEYHQALEAAAQAAQKAEAVGDGEGKARALLAAGQALGWAGRGDEAAMALDHAQREATAAHQPALAAEAAAERAEAALRLHDFAAARTACTVAIATAQQLGLISLELRVRRCESKAQRDQGDIQGALATSREAQLRAEIAELHGLATACAVDEAWMLADRGDRTAARRLADGVLLRAGQLHDRAGKIAVAEAHSLLGRLQAQAHEWNEAATELQRSVEALRTLDAPVALGAALLLLGQVEGARGNGTACGELLGEALVVTARHGLPEQQVVRRVIDRLRAQSGPAQSEPWLSEP
jgi:tetratricopeptide (TPR) repeat protein